MKRNRFEIGDRVLQLHVKDAESPLAYDFILYSHRVGAITGLKASLEDSAELFHFESRKEVWHFRTNRPAPPREAAIGSLFPYKRRFITRTRDLVSAYNRFVPVLKIYNHPNLHNVWGSLVSFQLQQSMLRSRYFILQIYFLRIRYRLSRTLMPIASILFLDLIHLFRSYRELLDLRENLFNARSFQRRLRLMSDAPHADEEEMQQMRDYVNRTTEKQAAATELFEKSARNLLTASIAILAVVVAYFVGLMTAK